MADTTDCVEIHDADRKCIFYMKTESCQTGGLFDYMFFIYCYIHPQYMYVAVFICILFLLMLFISLGVTADDFLCPSLVVITRTLHLSQNIAGVTFLAFGNGAPDIFSSLAGTEQARPELVMGTLLGGGIFVTSVVAGSIIASRPFKIMERPFLRDNILYVCAAFWTFLRLYYEEVTIWHSVGFIILYVIYILVVIVSRLVYNKYKNPLKIPEIETNLPSDKPDNRIPINKNPTFTFQPTGDDDNPEAAGVVLRRFSFRGSISVAKKRHSSAHSHHEHVIKSITQSVENPSFINGFPPPLESQISSTGLLTSNGEKSMLREFLLQVCPIDIEAWPDTTWPYKVFEVIKAPICGLLIITVPVVDYENDKNNWCRPLCVIQCLAAPMFVVFALGKYKITLWNTVPLWSIILIVSIIAAIIVYLTSSNNSQPIYHSLFGFIGFFASVVWVYLLASEIVSLLQTVGIVFKLSDTILGLTVLAWGNSIGDFISNLSVARQGYPRMGISACYGGPLLNLLLGIGIPYTIMIIKEGHPLKLKYQRLTTLLYSTLTLILLTTIVTMTLFRFQAKRCLGIILICMYITFLTIAIIFEIGVI